LERQRSAQKKRPLSPLLRKLKMHRNTKYWSFTWDTNVSQKKLPEKQRLQKFLTRIADYGQFQLEEGAVKQKQHYQGCFELTGPRQPKKIVLEMFKETFKNVSGLTLNKVYDKVAVANYTTKSIGRVDGPWYCGKKENYDEELSMSELRAWQQDLYKFLLQTRTSETKEAKELRDRAIYWVHDAVGNTGKSWFQEWLRYGQKELVCRKLPVSSVDRLISAVHHISKDCEPDIFFINLTRTMGEDQSYSDLFAALEEIKDGYVVDVMYGKYNETRLKKKPSVVIFTNQSLDSFRSYLSDDRWRSFLISHQQQLVMKEPCENGMFYVHEMKNLTKKYFSPDETPELISFTPATEKKA